MGGFKYIAIISMLSLYSCSSIEQYKRYGVFIGIVKDKHELPTHSRVAEIKQGQPVPHADYKDKIKMRRVKNNANNPRSLKMYRPKKMEFDGPNKSLSVPNSTTNGAKTCLYCY